MYKSEIVAAASAANTVAGFDKPAQPVSEARLARVRRSKSQIRLVASDIMTPPAVVAEAGRAVREVARLMLDEGVSAVPVIDATGAAIGMASDGDLLGPRPDDGRREWWLSLLAEHAASGDVFGAHADHPVHEVMSAPLISISARAPVQDIAQALHAHRIKRLPVLEDGWVLGVVSRADLLCVVEQLTKMRSDNRGAGPLSFLESLIGGASLRDGLNRAAPVKAQTKAAPPHGPVISAEAFRVRTFLPR